MKIELDKMYYNYNEIQFFLAPPARVCIEVGRVIRENIYTSKVVYNYQRVPEGKKYDLNAVY